MNATAQIHSVNQPEIHPNDYMFLFFKEMLGLPESVAIEQYLSHGRRSVAHLSEIVTRYAVAEPTILEFASGYGCVTRFVCEQLPHAKLTASDIHPEAITFIERTIGVQVAQSVNNPDDFDLHNKFDVVFALSFFTHMPRASWTRWLGALFRHVNDGGIVVFTAHGLPTLKNFNNPELDADGFWFTPVSEQRDLDPAEYGSCITSFDFVLAQIRTLSDARLINFQEAWWNNHQDIYVLRRAPAL